MRSFSIPGILLIGLTLAFSDSSAQQDQKKPPKKVSGVFTDPAEAGPDFLIQGEYEGEIAGKGKYGAQVVALGDGKFDVYFLAGGLPGAGWDTKTRTKVEAKGDGKETTLTSKGWSGVLADGKIVGKSSDDEFTL